MDTQKRLEWIDIAKAIAIMLVVFGHTMRAGTPQKIVYSFHVPLFFFVSGMTCKTDKLKHRILSDVKRIMIPYYCFGLISIMIFAILGKFVAGKFEMDVNTSISNNVFNLLYATNTSEALKFNTPLWFLPCLFVTKLMYYALSKLFSDKAVPIIVSTFLLAALGFGYSKLNLPALPFSLVIATKMLLFFALGRIFFTAFFPKIQKALKKPFALGIGSVLLIITCVIGYFSPKINYSGDHFPNILSFLTTACLGSICVCCLSIGISHSRILEYVGKNTLSILVMHKFPILVFQTIGPMKQLLIQYNSVSGNLLGAVPVSLVAIVLCLIAALIINKLFPFMLGKSYASQKTN